MSFAATLQRLRDAQDRRHESQRGTPAATALVRREDLRELIRVFEYIDGSGRALHELRYQTDPKPISGAPRDGRSVILLAPHIIDPRDRPAAWGASWDAKLEYFAASADGEPIRDATHWISYPAALLKKTEALAEACKAVNP